MKQAPAPEMKDLHTLLVEMAKAARVAYRTLADATNERKDMALVASAMRLREQEKVIMMANAKDVEAAKERGLSAAMIDRLVLNEARIESMAAGLETIATMHDPINRMIEEWERPNGLLIQKVSVPLGVIGIIYESRPNVTADAAGLCIKSGNAAILRGGSESLHSSQAILECIHYGLKQANLPEACVQMVPVPDREAVGELLTLAEYIDVIIPRGGKSLTERVMKESRVPTLLHLEGNCHTYIHASAEADMAEEVLINAKMRRTGVCGATESLVMDEAALNLLPRLVDALTAKGCAVKGDKAAQAADKRIEAATEEDFRTEYLDAVISVKTVKGVEEAIEHVNAYGSHHTDAIIAKDLSAVRKFLRKVDSAIVVHNASTQFADGGEFGFGAEIGIATGRLHARGPVGADQLTTYKYVLHGTGQTRP
jgi:glutamate-5-semialdehyde dehydrogenase